MIQENLQCSDIFKSTYCKTSEELQNQIAKLKSYINKYDLIPVLMKAFENDNFIFRKGDGTINDDYLLSNYITDLYLSFQRNNALDKPDKDTIEKIFDCCMEINNLCFILEKVGDKIDENIKDKVLMMKYTERSLYIPIYNFIFSYLIDTRFLSYFYEQTGFYLQHVFLFRTAITLLIQERYEKEKEFNGKNLAFSAEDIFSFLKDNLKDNSIVDLCQIKKFIEYFLLDFSDNNDFLPRFDNPVKERPIFKWHEKYICSNPMGFIRNIFPIMENEIKKDEKKSIDYFTTKGKNLEKFTSSVLSILFPYATIYQGLKYYPEDKKEHESDIIIDIGNYLLIVEAKAGKFRSQARQGNSSIFKRSINNIITDAHEQCKKAYEYIQNNEVSFFYQKGNREKVVSFERKRLIDIYLITVELENLDSITSDIYNTVPIYDKNPIITFSIYDLCIITNVLKNGVLFSIYLEQRRKTILDKKIAASTELDYLSLFLDRDLQFNGKEYDKAASILITNYSDVLDRYFIEGEKIKPYPMAVGANILFQQLQKYNEQLSFVVEKEFLSANINVQKEILRKINTIKKRALKGGRHDCSFLLEKEHVGISFFSYKKEIDFTDEDYIKKYVCYKLKEKHTKFWFYIVFIVKPTKVLLIDYINVMASK